MRPCCYSWAIPHSKFKLGSTSVGQRLPRKISAIPTLSPGCLSWRVTTDQSRKSEYISASMHQGVIFARIGPRPSLRGRWKRDWAADARGWANLFTERWTVVGELAFADRERIRKRQRGGTLFCPWWMKSTRSVEKRPSHGC